MNLSTITRLSPPPNRNGGHDGKHVQNVFRTSEGGNSYLQLGQMAASLPPLPRFPSTGNSSPQFGHLRSRCWPSSVGAIEPVGIRKTSKTKCRMISTNTSAPSTPSMVSRQG